INLHDFAVNVLLAFGIDADKTGVFLQLGVLDAHLEAVGVLIYVVGVPCRVFADILLDDRGTFRGAQDRRKCRLVGHLMQLSCGVTVIPRGFALFGQLGFDFHAETIGWRLGGWLGKRSRWRRRG